MASGNKKSIVSGFLSSNKTHPVLAALATGLYPILFYYSRNFTLVNTWEHLGYFVLWFLLVPMIIFFGADKLSNLSRFHKIKKYVLPFLTIFVFLFLLKVCLFAEVQRKMIVGIIAVAFLGAYFFNKSFKKLIVIQLLLGIIGAVNVSPHIVKQLTQSNEWATSPDDIEKTIFKKKPNLYFIQPDGYANNSELKKGYYQFDNSNFSNFLSNKGFTYYNNFRSNYASTLTSNVATFMMKHHYYFNGSDLGELFNARDILITNNHVLDAFKNNQYKTHFITELPYLLLNRPKMGYDYCNFDYKDVSFIGTGLGKPRDVKAPLLEKIEDQSKDSNFFFIELFNPGHIARTQHGTILEEREKWKASLDRANIKLEELISMINDKDPNSLIVIMADHGGFVGMTNTEKAYDKTEDRDLIYSIFSSTLAIKWPEDTAPDYEPFLKSSVNVFRVLFSYLSEDDGFLQHLQPNESYMVIKNKAPKGVYKYIDENGVITFKKYQLSLK